jgi:hypothetical protein
MELWLNSKFLSLALNQPNRKQGCLIGATHYCRNAPDHPKLDKDRHALLLPRFKRQREKDFITFGTWTHW